MKIPITMCHGIRDDGEKPLPVERLDALMRVASEMGFTSINYDQYAAWREGTGTLPERPVLIDFDHPIKNMRYETHDTLAKYGFTGTSWSSIAEAEVKKRFRFGRLWIIGSEYKADGRTIRYADLVGVPGEDEADGGPPMAARYATKETDPYRLPSMEFQHIMYEPDDFRRYLEGALEG